MEKVQEQRSAYGAISGEGAMMQGSTPVEQAREVSRGMVRLPDVWGELPRLAVIVIILIAIVAGALFTRLSTTEIVMSGAAMLVVALLIAQQHELLAAVVIGIALLIDWYQIVQLPVYLPVVASAAATLALVVMFLTQSRQKPWIPIPDWWLWGILLVVALVPMVRASTLLGGGRYYVTVLLTPFLLFVLGLQISRDMISLRRLLVALSALATVIAIHSIIQSRFGITLLATPTLNSYLATVSDYRLNYTGPIRAGSFLTNPDWDGNFLAMMVFPPLGLLVASASRRAQIFYGAEIATILLGLLFTYSGGSFVAAVPAALLFFLMMGGRQLLPRIFGAHNRYRWPMIAAACLALAAVAVGLRSELGSLISHALAPHDILLRFGAWLTGLRVIAAYPLTGVGLSLQTYLSRSQAYRVTLQTLLLAQPHNSYIELGALGGLPVLAAFIAILARMLRLALRYCASANGPSRALLVGATAAVVELAVNSMIINAWTLAPIAALGWLILGAVVSPGLQQALHPKPLFGRFSLRTEEPTASPDLIAEGTH